MGSIPYTCPHCGTYSVVASEFAGRTGPCAQCGKSITVPAATMADDPYGAVILPPMRRSSKLWIGLLLTAGVTMVLCIGLVGSMIMPMIRAAAEQDRRKLCESNLLVIAAALDNYHTDYGSYPPAYLADAGGRPMHSWRALLLRYVDEEAAKQYDFDQPWDSESNQKLAANMPAAYGCPSNPESALACTSYVAIVGQGYFFSGHQPTRKNQIKDPAATIAVVETAGQVTVPWLEPRDIAAAELSGLLGDRDSPSISSNHVHGANVLMADGVVRYLPDDTPAATISRQLPIAPP